MEAAIQYAMIFIAGWIASMWPGAWTPLLFILSLSAMCFAKAIEMHFSRQNKNKGRTRNKNLGLAP